MNKNVPERSAFIPAGVHAADARAAEGRIKLTGYASLQPGPVREFKPLIELTLDEAHATELLGTLAIALEHIRQRAAIVGPPPGASASIDLSGLNPSQRAEVTDLITKFVDTEVTNLSQDRKDCHE